MELKKILWSMLALTALPCAADVQGLGNQKIASYKVMTAQFAAASKAAITNLQRVAEGEMAALSIQASLLDQMMIYRQYSPLVGQGAQVCDAVNNNSDIDIISRSRPRIEMGNLSTAGRPKIDPSNYIATRVKDQLENYCTADEHNLGLCRAKFDGMAAAASDFGKLMDKELFTSKELKASNDFVANMVPPPAPKVSKNNCKTSSCLELVAAARSMDAFGGLVANSYASVFSSRVGTKSYPEFKAGE